MKKNGKVVFIITLILLFIIIYSRKKVDTNNDDSKNIVSNDKNTELSSNQEVDEITRIVDNMTYEEKIGQLFILGFYDSEYTDAIDKLIKEEKIGGFIFFDRNIKNKNQIKNLSRKIYKVNKEENNLPLFMSIDEESKTVSRLKNIYGDLPTLEEIGKKNDRDLSYNYGRLLGKRLKNLGFNLNFSPVIDINSNKNNPVINVRSLGSDPYIVSENSKNIINGQNYEGIISCVKHFPGHGDTNVDSHIDVPIIYKTEKELNELELIPFTKAIENNVDMIMISHILLPKIDDNISSLSNKIMQGILKENLGYEGVIISDDLTMQSAIISAKENPAVEFILAGGDLALISHDMNMYYDAVEKLREEFKDKLEILNDKVYRIVKLKHKYLLEKMYIDSYEDEEIIDYTKKIKGRI